MVVTDIKDIYRGPGTGIGAPVSPIREHVEKRTYDLPRVTRGRAPPVIRKKPPEVKRKVITAIKQLPKSKQILFVKREATRIDQAIKKQSKKYIPTLKDISVAGYNYGKAHPKSAKLIYDSLDAKARIIRKVVPKNIGEPSAKVMYAFSDGAIKGIRNEPVKTLAFFALPGAVGVAGRVAKGIPVVSNIVKSEKAMKAAAVGFNIAYGHNIYTRVNAPVLDFYKDGKVISETSKKLPDGSIQITQQIEQIPVMRKPSTSEKSERLGYVFSTEAGPMVFGAMGMSKVSSARFKELGRKDITTTKTQFKKFKKGTKEFIKAEKAEAQLIRKKKKRPVQKLVQIQKPEPKVIRVSEITGLAKPEIIQKVVLIKDPKAIALAKSNKELLKEAKAVVGIKTRPLKQRELLEFEKSTPEALKHVDQSIEQQLKQLNNVKAVVTQKKVKTKISVITKEYNKIKTINSELRVKYKLLSEQYTQLRSLLKAKRTVATKQKISNLVKSIAKSQSGIKVLFGQREKVLTKIRTEIRILSKQKDIVKAVQLLKTRAEIVPKRKPKVKPKVTPRVKPKVKPRVRPKVKPKPKIKPVPIPKIIPFIPKKPPTKKKKKKVKKAVKEAFIKNPVPSLKAFLG
jgi:hypothetical protein